MVAQRCPQGGSGETHVRRAAFTMVELLIVILIIAVLVALLLPAIMGAIRRARQAAIVSEINVMATNLGQFKSSYGFYPPSRLYLDETGFFNTANATSLAVAGGTDMTMGQLAQRSLRYIQRMFPRVPLSTTAAVLSGNAFYDFNGNGTSDGTYILEGPQCLVFFLGGVPVYDPGTGSFTGMGGWGKNPVNPFSNSILSEPRTGLSNAAGQNYMYSGARTTPIAEFKNSRLALVAGLAAFPSYWDQQSPPSAGAHNVYVYFSAYEGAGYDPNDTNFIESDTLGNSPIMCGFSPGVISPSPNPYTNSVTTPVGGVISYQGPQSFQIIAAGDDGLFGVGGQYTPNNPGTATPFDAGGPGTRVSPYSSSDPSLRQMEHDNLTSFATGPLG